MFSSATQQHPLSETVGPTVPRFSSVWTRRGGPEPGRRSGECDLSRGNEGPDVRLSSEAEWAVGFLIC